MRDLSVPQSPYPIAIVLWLDETHLGSRPLFRQSSRPLQAIPQP